ncbi:hypothetical protein [Modestobacter altitudinis]|uniref:hypothetical protein n=1 Tax=Modestobacter altitudinis TaxID=2213158 RepID=UPI0015D0E00F|nr:hypothetical protein [Modestobacter altitudinis]
MPHTPTRVTRDVPEAVRALSSLSRIDYADRSTLRTEVVATPEQWARAMFGDVPSPAEQVIWRGVLGFRLSTGRSPATVGGWRIGGRGADWIRLETTSRSLSADMLVQTGSGAVAWTTCLRFDRLPGRALWAPASAVHRRLVPGVLRAAAARLDARAGAGRARELPALLPLGRPATQHPRRGDRHQAPGHDRRPRPARQQPLQADERPLPLLHGSPDLPLD